MNQSEVVDFINELEVRFPVDIWSIDGLHVWPVLRIWLFNAVLTRHIAQQAPTNHSRQLLERLSGRIRGNVRFARAVIGDYSHNARLNAPADALFLSDGVSFAQLDGYWYERFCDPLIEALADRGLSSRLMSPLHSYLVPRHTSSAFIQPAIDLAVLHSLASPRHGTNLRLPGFDEIASETTRRFPDVMPPNVERLLRQTARIRAVAGFFAKILARVSPRIAFAVSYYSLDNMGFVLACRRNNVPVLDVQHGLQGDHHIAYGRWQKVPPRGYDLLPTMFWCWSDEEARAIRRWSAPLGGTHLPFVGGNLWLETWLRGDAEVVSRYDEKILGIKRHHTKRGHVLLTLPWGVAWPEVERQLTLVGSSNRDFVWWVRLHPAATCERERVRELLSTRAASCSFELDAATDMPLYALLRHMDAHVTHCSSTVLEAREFGLRSIISSEYGGDLFRDEIAQGWGVLAVEPAQFRRTLEQIVIQRTNVNATEARRKVAKRSLDELLSQLETVPSDDHRSRGLAGRKQQAPEAAR